MTREEAIEVFNELKKCYLGGIVDAIDVAIEALKEQEPVKPILKNGWYWCGGIRCRNSLTSVIDDNAPARKPSYCERCGRAVKWE